MSKGKPDFEGVVLNPDGEAIFITRELFFRLHRMKYGPKTDAAGRAKKLKALVRDKESGLWKMTEWMRGLMPLFGGPDYRPGRTSDGPRPRDSGPAHRTMNILGADLSGLPCNPEVRWPRRQGPDPALPEGYIWVNEVATKVKPAQTDEGIGQTPTEQTSL